ncbi:MAG: two-component sensor histidine kinase, partial [Propionivibrio sp.]
MSPPAKWSHELQDDVLRQVATLFDRHHFTAPEKGNADKDREGDTDTESRVFVQLYPASTSADGKSGGTLLALPQDLADGLQTARAGGEIYRVLIRTLATGERVAVAQETAL